MEIKRISGGDIGDGDGGRFDDEGDNLLFPASYAPAVAAVLDLDPLGALAAPPSSRLWGFSCCMQGDLVVLHKSTRSASVSRCDRNPDPIPNFDPKPDLTLTLNLNLSQAHLRLLKNHVGG